MEHYLTNSATFNHLTNNSTKGGVVLTGETQEGIEVGDLIKSAPKDNNPFVVKEILERRDSIDYPAGNNYFYKVLCQ